MILVVQCIQEGYGQNSGLCYVHALSWDTVNTPVARQAETPDCIGFPSQAPPLGRWIIKVDPG
jgi:hypothetical protein